MKVWKYFGIALLVIVIDQIVKLLVFFNMGPDPNPNYEISIIGDFFKLHYVLNEGMAFGMTLGFKYGKLFLTLFRLVAVGLIGYYMVYLYKKKSPVGLLVCAAMVLGGALGNVLDSIFYGVFLDNAPYDAPMQWFHGQVVDMFYLDIYDGKVADWVPIFGGDNLFLWPIFNIADAAIFVSVIFLLIKQKTYFPGSSSENESSTTAENEPMAS